MNIAIRYGAAIVDADGHVSGHDAGATLVRRLLRVFPEARLIGPGPRQGEGFDVIPLEFVDGSDTVVINMDVIDSVGVWQTLKEHCDEPKLMNFVWFNTVKYEHRVQRSALGLSCGLFPTFANSERTANEIREIVSGWTIKPIWEEARIAWVNLGIRLEHVQPRMETSVPVVLYGRWTGKRFVLANESAIRTARLVTTPLGGTLCATSTRTVKVSDSPTSSVFVPVAAFVSERM